METQQERISRFQKLRAWYGRYERPISSLFLIGGFIFNALFLKRVDEFWENFWILVHLLIVAIAIILLQREEMRARTANPAQEAKAAGRHFWLRNILQFMFGGLLSTFIVFYFRSAVIAVSWPFFLLLIIAFFANERFKKHYDLLAFQVGFLYLSLFLFLIFFIPVLSHTINREMFIVSGALSIFLIALFLRLLSRLVKGSLSGRTGGLAYSVIIGICALLNILYFTDLIPPLPLSLSDAGVFHAVARNSSGSYTALSEENSSLKDRILSHFNIYNTLHISPSASAYAYSAVFSPIAFKTNIIHEWQRYDVVQGRWVAVVRIPLVVSGGRENGYRTYSLLNNLTPGKWRVNIQTQGGQTIGRLVFTVENTDTEPELISQIKD